MTAETTEPLYLLRKRDGGLYWRPDFCGYTPLKAEAGRYTAAEAAPKISPTSEMIPEWMGDDDTTRRGEVAG